MNNSRLDVPLKFVQYVDDEGDKIAVDSDADLEEAHTVFKSLGRIPTFIVNKTAVQTTASKSARSRCAGGYRPMPRCNSIVKFSGEKSE